MNRTLDRITEGKNFLQSTVAPYIADKFINTNVAGASVLSLKDYPEFDPKKDCITTSEFSDKIRKIKSCAHILEWVRYENEETDKLRTANFCKAPIVCPICAARESAKRKAIFGQKIKKYSVDTYPYMITFTIEGQRDLKDGINILQSARRKFRRMGQRRKGGRRSGGEAGKIISGLSNVEIKTGSGSGLYHVHDHFLAFCDDRLDFNVYDPKRKKAIKKYQQKTGNYDKSDFIIAVKKWYLTNEGYFVPVSKVSEQWIKATGGRGMSIQISPLAPKRKHLKKGLSVQESVLYQCNEVLKYPCKISDFRDDEGQLDLFRLKDLFEARKNRRLFNRYGDFIKMNMPDIPEKKIINRYLLQWQKGKYEFAGERNFPSFNNYQGLAPRAQLLSECAKITGAYLRNRRSILDNRQNHPELENDLDRLKEIYRAEIGYTMKNYTPEYIPPPEPFEPEQISMFPVIAS